MTRSFLWIGALVCAVSSPSLQAQNGTATFELVLNSTWSRATHPIAFPSNPHYSQLVGTNHRSSASLWAPGAQASVGIQRVAEFGSNGSLQSEVNALIASDDAQQWFRLGGINSPGTLTTQITVSTEFPELSLATMVAPSPDWFVGVHGLSLMQNGDWIDQVTAPMFVYDAGTDSGSSYNSSNQATLPHAPIARVTTASGPFLNLPGAVGTMTLRRLHGSAVHGCGINPAGSFGVQGQARIGQTLTFSIHDPTIQMGTPAASALGLSTTPLPSFPCGMAIPNFGLTGPGMPGELLLDGAFAAALGPTWNGSAVSFPLTIPNQVGFIGQKFYFQGVLGDGSRVGLTDGAAVLIGG